MSRNRDIAMFLSLAVLWGFSFPAISVGLESLPPLLFAAARYDIAAVLLLTAAIVRVEKWRPTARNDLAAVAGGGVFLIAGNGLLFLGQQTVPSGVAAILQGLVPILTALWAIPLLGERLSGLGAVGAAIGFFGVGLVVQPDPGNLLAGDTGARLLIVGQVCSVALGGVLIQRAGPTLEQLPLVGWSMLVGGLVLHAVSLGAGEGPGAAAIGPVSLTALLYLGVFATAVAFMIYFTILEEHGAFEAALIGYLVPIVATAAGVVLLGESIGALTIAGFALVAVGFALLKRRTIADAVGLSTGVGSP
ncbi:EamA family transporter [Haloterrigena sp. SYSU A558-1]|uniref:EamA family transporter n=1 Tax=Haloterrigena gelatinilytica TaxID=2741724 RepID=A0A8J8KD18_9EURY|nr:EamA family transporter [Haloterrigena gelatinilytica]NUB93025.1 EamA family transporter [Haloterrigena gelatinilytica]NUC71065.1 EamA family transporter [Haloterrigena gelatinilytica]